MEEQVEACCQRTGENIPACSKRIRDYQTGKRSGGAGLYGLQGGHPASWYGLNRDSKEPVLINASIVLADPRSLAVSGKISPIARSCKARSIALILKIWLSSRFKDVFSVMGNTLR
jgi:hypothetical protein